MRRKQAGDVVRLPDKYKQVRVVREDEVAPKKAPLLRPAPPYVVGDVLTTAYRPLLFMFNQPIICLELYASEATMSGWVVKVDTSAGVKAFCSSHFKKKP